MLLLFLIVVFSCANLLGQRTTISYDISFGPALNWSTSDDIYFEPNAFDFGWNAEFLTNIPLTNNYFFSVGAGISVLNTSLRYNSDSVRTSYFTKKLDTRDMVWDYEANYFSFPLLINMQTDAINDKSRAFIGVGVINKKLFRSNFNIYNQDVAEYSYFKSIRNYNISFTMRVGFQQELSRNNVILTQFYYERSLLPLQTYTIPNVFYESIGIKLGWKFKTDN